VTRIPDEPIMPPHGAAWFGEQPLEGFSGLGLAQRAMMLNDLA
jgi:hypothetical protein